MKRSHHKQTTDIYTERERERERENVKLNNLVVFISQRNALLVAADVTSLRSFLAFSLGCPGWKQCAGGNSQRGHSRRGNDLASWARLLDLRKRVGILAGWLLIIQIWRQKLKMGSQAATPICLNLDGFQWWRIVLKHWCDAENPWIRNTEVNTHATTCYTFANSSFVLCVQATKALNISFIRDDSCCGSRSFERLKNVRYW